ncbi:MAG: hypothetical protein CMH54_10190 [Myxococcales bacterium]|nr:hypothetical protein [Myxococcales bacterium]
MGRTPRNLYLLVLWFALSCGGADSPDLSQGEDLYMSFCAFCHGTEGEGFAADGANALNNQNFLAVASDAFLRDAIRRGRPGTPMSAWSDEFAGPLSDNDVQALVQYIRHWQTEPNVDVHDMVVSGEPARVEGIYEIACASCHGAEGEGGTYMSLNNPEFLATASDGFLHYSISHGRPNTPMNAYGSQLLPQEINDLVALIRSWETPIQQRSGDVPTPFTAESAVIHPEGPDPAFEDTERFVSVEQVYEELSAGARMILVDARVPSDYILNHITGSVSAPFYDIELYMDELPQDVWIVAYCGCPHEESGIVVDALSEAGYTKARVLDEGYFVWELNEYPILSGPDPGDYPIADE